MLPGLVHLPGPDLVSTWTEHSTAVRIVRHSSPSPLPVRLTHAVCLNLYYSHVNIYTAVLEWLYHRASAALCDGLLSATLLKGYLLIV